MQCSNPALANQPAPGSPERPVLAFWGGAPEILPVTVL